MDQAQNPRQPTVLPPHGLSQIIERFGYIRGYVRPDGTMRPEWERHILGTAALPAPLPLSWDTSVKVSHIRCHALLVSAFEDVFHLIEQGGLWRELRTYGGCFAWRAQRGSSVKWSLHAWGAAIDLNPGTNELGTPGDMHPGVVECFERRGFVWGGRFARPDPMHFQFAEDY